MKTLQDAFNVAATGLLEQNTRSMVEDIGCSYRGDEGRKCAIGMLLTDECYYPGLEGKTPKGSSATFTSPEDYRVKEAIKASGYPVDDKAIGFYMSLQSIHDNDMVRHWPKNLESLANSYALDTTAIQQYLP